MRYPLPSMLILSDLGQRDSYCQSTPGICRALSHFVIQDVASTVDTNSTAVVSASSVDATAIAAATSNATDCVATVTVTSAADATVVGSNCVEIVVLY